MPFINIILIAVLIEAIVSAVKPLWSKGTERMSVAEIVAIVLGIALCEACHIDMLEYLIPFEVATAAPPWMVYVFYGLTGIAVGRGPSFLWDLWNRVRQVTESAEALKSALPVTLEQDGTVSLNVSTWSADQLKAFCEANGIDSEGCAEKEDYILRIRARETGQPPDAGGGEE